MIWILFVLGVLLVIAFQMRTAFRGVAGLARKLQDPDFVARVQAGDREALRRELASVLGAEEAPAGEDTAAETADALLARWHRARGTTPPAQTGAPAAPAGLRFERAGVWPLLAVLAVAALLAFLRLQG
jgi:hypothetical protein